MACFEGGCHCGAITVRFTSDMPFDSLVPRADQCGFCRKHNAAVISDPAGHLDITSAEAAGPPYRFGLHITDFHICKQCGVFVAATGAGEGRCAAWSIFMRCTTGDVSSSRSRSALMTKAWRIVAPGDSSNWTPASVTHVEDVGPGSGRA